jgi:hypothetical protein
MRQETLLQNDTTGSGAHHASHPAGTVVSFPEDNGVGPTLRSGEEMRFWWNYSLRISDATILHRVEQMHLKLLRSLNRRITVSVH